MNKFKIEVNYFARRNNKAFSVEIIVSAENEAEAIYIASDILEDNYWPEIGLCTKIDS